jgi:signal transduction histidine kinase
MQEDATVQGKYSTDLRLIIGEIDRLGASVAQLLNFARPDPGPRGSVRLQELTGSVIEFLRRDIEQIAAVVENQIPDDLPQVVGSAAAHREILLNLLLNALQAGGKGTHVWVQAWEGILEDGSERFVLIVVEDDGPGISAEAQRRIFEPFFTTKQRGTGLGLAIVKRNVEYYGGRITVESPAREGRGTRFLMHLPLA